MADENETPDLWHRPVPGPLYWDFRCTRCGQDVIAHPGLLARWAHRRAERKAARASR